MLRLTLQKTTYPTLPSNVMMWVNFYFNNPNYENKIHTIVIDPPRAGISPKSLRKVIRLNAKKNCVCQL